MSKLSFVNCDLLKCATIQRFCNFYKTFYAFRSYKMFVKCCFSTVKYKHRLKITALLKLRIKFTQLNDIKCNGRVQIMSVPHFEQTFGTKSLDTKT